MLLFPVPPGDLDPFVEQVVPELRRRGLARRDHPPGTLRDRLGLERPGNRVAAR